MSRIRMTLCIVHQPPRILLATRKFGLCQDKLVGFGGEVKAGETAEQSVVHRTQEEAGITLVAPVEFGITESVNKPMRHEVYETHIFCAHSYDGVVTENVDIRPEWFTFREIPLEKMWPSYLLWLPYLLQRRRFRAQFLYNFGQILEHCIGEVAEL